LVDNLQPNTSHFNKAMAHVLGKSVNYDYLYSDARVKMGGPHPEEEQGQLLMIDRKASPVTLDMGFRPSIVYSTKSPFFRQGVAPPLLSRSSGYNGSALPREAQESGSESDDSDSESDSKRDDLKPILGKRRARHQRSPSPIVIRERRYMN
jgi:hypothetical protein